MKAKLKKLKIKLSKLKREKNDLAKDLISLIENYEIQKLILERTKRFYKKNLKELKKKRAELKEK